MRTDYPMKNLDMMITEVMKQKNFLAMIIKIKGKYFDEESDLHKFN